MEGDRVALVSDFALEESSYTDPLFIRSTNTGEFVVGGRLNDGGFAWATRLKGSGAVQWRYTMTAADPAYRAQFPYFTGAVPLADAATLLCGMIDSGRNGSRDVKGLIVRLDRNGKQLSEQYISPNLPEYEFAHTIYLDQCINWNGGVALIGRFSTTDYHGIRANFHWIVRMSSSGDVRWNKLIPMSDDVERSQARTTINGRLLIFTGEVISIDPQGELKARSVPVGRLRLVRPTDERSNIQLLNCYGGDNRGRLVELNDDLRIETDRRLQFPDGYVCGPPQYSSQTYGLPDGSIVVFGYRYENRRRVPGIVKWTLPENNPQAQIFPLRNSPWFSAASSTNEPGIYITVRVAGAPTMFPFHPERSVHVTLFDVNNH